MQIDVIESAALSAWSFAELHALCRVAYDEDLEQYFVDIGPGIHWVGSTEGVVVSHAMLVERWLQPEHSAPIRTAFVELVATHPDHQGRGYGSTLLRAMVPTIDTYGIGALTPTVPAFYARLGWEFWRGPLGVRIDNRVEPTPEEELMFRRTPLTPPTLDPTAPISIEWRPGEIW